MIGTAAVQMSFSHPTIERYNGSDGAPLVVRRWAPADGAHAHVVWLHGIVSHGGWYGRCCAHLAQAGCFVHFLERRGSGLSTTPRGDVTNGQTWIDDVVAYLGALDPACPRILAGISWGGKLAAVTAAQRPDLVEALALVCPGIYAQQQPGPFAQWMLRWGAMPGIALHRVPIPLQDAALFTSAPQHQKFVRHDPLALRRVTLRFAAADVELTRRARAVAAELRMPTLLALAGRDRIVRNDHMQSFFRALAAADRTLLEYPSAGHTLEFEQDPSGYFDDLTAWVRRTIDAAKSS